MTLDTEDLNSNNSLKNKDKMGLFGRGWGYLGLPIAWNTIIRLIIIWVVFGGLGIYLWKINQFWAGLISLACGLMFSAFNNFLRSNSLTE